MTLQHELGWIYNHDNGIVVNDDFITPVSEEPIEFDLILALFSSGLVFCYVCIVKYLRKHGKVDFLQWDQLTWTNFFEISKNVKSDIWDKFLF